MQKLDYWLLKVFLHTKCIVVWKLNLGYMIKNFSYVQIFINLKVSIPKALTRRFVRAQ